MREHKAVRKVLPHYYRNGPPTWKEGASQRHAKTRQQAIEERRQLVNELRRYGKDDADALDLADRLERCHRNHRCRSGACPECLRAFQRAFVMATDTLIKADQRPFTILSILGTSRYREDRLNAKDPFSRLQVKLAKRLHRAGVGIALGGFDISANEHQTAQFRPHWQPHAWILVPTVDLEPALRELRKSFAKRAAGHDSKPKRGRRTVIRPIVCKAFDGDLAGLAYAVKGDFLRRVTLPKVTNQDGSTKTRRNSRTRPLRPQQKVELRLMLDRAGLHGRIFIHGMGLDAVMASAKPRPAKPKRKRGKRRTSR